MPGAVSYLDFDLLIRRAGGSYRAQVLSSPAGEATADFTLPFSELELENFVLRVGRPRRGTRRIGSPEMEAVRTLGRGLYEAVFGGDVRACWRASLDEAEARGATGLRLRLRIADAPELNHIPWEYLYNASRNHFLSLSEYTPLVRYLDMPERIRPLVVNGRLEILTMISSPTDYPGLDVEHEWSRLNAALAELVGNGQVRLERLPEARLSALQRRLRGGEYHILHFIGHGGFDPRTQEGVLVLQDEAGKGSLTSAERLGTILHNHRSLRLVVLNACEGARASSTDPFAGTAQTLVQQGIPAVIAMQFEITDQAAITLAEEFYAAMADGYPVDAALSAARTAIFAAGNDIEWGTPVLYLRAPNGQLFSLNPEPEAARQAEGEKRRAEAKSPALIAAPSSGQVILPVAAEAEEKYAQQRDADLPDFAVFKDAPFAPEMVAIPAGEFWMGSPEDEEGRFDSEGPRHRVTIGRRFAIGRYPLTFAEYDRFCEADRREWPDDRGWGRGRRPAVNISRVDAQTYLAWVSRETGRAHRLPSEAEWEYACRASTTTRYSFGDQIEPKDANCRDWLTNRTSEVGAYPPNPWGLCDMHGNVWEWVEDDWHENYRGAPIDGSAWKDNRADCVVRGGSWFDYSSSSRSAYRYWYEPGLRNDNVGFRVARTLD